MSEISNIVKINFDIIILIPKFAFTMTQEEFDNWVSSPQGQRVEKLLCAWERFKKQRIKWRISTLLKIWG